MDGPGSVDGMTERLPPAVRRLVAGVAVSSFGTGLTLPFTLILLSEVRGIALPTVGLLLAVPGVVGLLAVPVSGALVDRIGPRTVLRGALVLQAAANVGLATATSPLRRAARGGPAGAGARPLVPRLERAALRPRPRAGCGRPRLRRAVHGPQREHRPGRRHGGDDRRRRQPAHVRRPVRRQRADLPRLRPACSRRRRRAGSRRRTRSSRPTARCWPTRSSAGSASSRCCSRSPATPPSTAASRRTPASSAVSARRSSPCCSPSTRRSSWEGSSPWSGSCAAGAAAAPSPERPWSGPSPGGCSCSCRSCRRPDASWRSWRTAGCSGWARRSWRPSSGPLVNALATDRLRGRYNATQGATFSVAFVVGPALAALLVGTGLGVVWVSALVARLAAVRRAGAAAAPPADARAGRHRAARAGRPRAGARGLTARGRAGASAPGVCRLLVLQPVAEVVAAVRLVPARPAPAPSARCASG